jgi:hypothetical protein
MNFFLGREVKVKTTLGDEFEGEIFAIDVEHTASLMLRQHNDKFHWIKTGIVREIRPTSNHRSSTPDSAHDGASHHDSTLLPPVDWNAIAARERLMDERITAAVAKTAK